MNLHNLVNKIFVIAWMSAVVFCLIVLFYEILLSLTK